MKLGSFKASDEVRVSVRARKLQTIVRTAKFLRLQIVRQTKVRVRDRVTG